MGRIIGSENYTFSNGQQLKIPIYVSQKELRKILYDLYINCHCMQLNQIEDILGDLIDKIDGSRKTPITLKNKDQEK